MLAGAAFWYRPRQLKEPPHSSLSACTGSTLAARIAGINDAITATTLPYAQRSRST
jgi:hypothetical protein